MFASTANTPEDFREEVVAEITRRMAYQFGSRESHKPNSHAWARCNHAYSELRALRHHLEAIEFIPSNDPNAGL